MTRRTVEATREFTVTIDWIGTEVSDAEGADVRDVAVNVVTVEDRQVASVSGHRTWNSLKRYTHIRQAGDRWAGWPVP